MARSEALIATDISFSASAVMSAISVLRLFSVADSSAARLRLSRSRLCSSTLSSLIFSLRLRSLSEAATSAGLATGVTGRDARLIFGVAAGAPTRVVGAPEPTAVTTGCFGWASGFLKRENIYFPPGVDRAVGRAMVTCGRSRQRGSVRTATWRVSGFPCAAGSWQHFQTVAGRGHWPASPARRRRAVALRWRCQGFRPCA